MGKNTTGSEYVTITKLERPTHAEDGPGLTAAEYRKSQIINELSYLLWQIRGGRPGSADSDWRLANQMYDLAEKRIQAQVHATAEREITLLPSKKENLRY